MLRYFVPSRGRRIAGRTLSGAARCRRRFHRHSALPPGRASLGLVRMPFAVARAIVAFAPVGDVRERSRVERAHARVSSRGLRRSGSLPPFPIPPTLFDDARTPPPDPVRAGRRLFLAIALGVHAESSRPFARTASAAPDPSASAASLQEAAVRAFSERDFASATASLRRLTDLEPSNPSWREALGQCLVDSGTTASEFRAAAAEFDAALALTASGDAISSARLLAGRALAREGSGEWTAALADYDAALATAASAGLPPDPFILNSRGNALAALGEYASARAAYLDAASGFRGASATRRERETSNAVRSDGVAFAAANAALALAQLGDLAGAKEEMRRVSRKAPGVVDARAALAALYWGEGDGEDAEREWEFACDKISVGCAKYRDEAWVRGVRRWPPKMADLLDDFLNLREPSEARFFAG